MLYCIGEPKWKNSVIATLPTYRSWKAMHYRCTKTKNIGYARYGGRGIQVCDRWIDFDNFVEDMGIRPIGTTLDRINNDGNYEPGNCQWATKNQQGGNQSTNRYLSFQGRTQHLSQWASELNVPRQYFRCYVERYGADIAIRKFISRMEF